MEVVGDDRTLKGCGVGLGLDLLAVEVSNSLGEVLAWVSYPCWDLDESEYLLVEAVVAQGAVHGFEEDVDAFVFKFVAAAGGYDEGVVVKLEACEGVGDVENALAGCFACLGKGCSFGDKVSFETVGEYGVAFLVEEFLAFAACDLAYGGKAVYEAGCLALKAVFGFDVELLRHLCAVVAPEVVVEGLAVAGYAAAYGGGVGGEDGGYLGDVLLDIHGSEAGHPFVCLIDYVAAGLGEVVAVKAFDNEGCCV